VLGAPTTGTVTIADDDPAGQIDFKSLHYDVDETDGQATVTVQRVDGVGGAVSIDYATSGGTATAGSDYADASGTLTFGPGEASKSFTVPVMSDSTHEGDETFQVTLSNAGGGASLGSPAGGTVTITDDDAAPATPGTPPSGGDPPVFTPSGTVTLDLSLRARKAQRLRPRRARLTLSARCSADCTLRVGGKIKLSRARLSSLTTRQARAKTLKLRAKTFQLTAGTPKTLKLVVSRRLARKLLAGMKQGRRVSAALKGTATNPAGTPGTRSIAIRLKR
jgi:hypothetical protein